MRRVVMAAVVTVGMAGTGIGAGPPSSPFGYAVFGIGDVLLRDNVRAIDGDVGSNDGTVTVGQDVRVAGAVAGRTIRLRKNAAPDAAYCLLLEGAPAGVACQSVTLPVVSSGLLPAVQVVPGATTIKIPKGGSTSPIPPGAYGNVKVRPRGELRLAGGTYAFRSINLGSRARLVCLDACNVGVANRVRVQSRAFLGGAGGVGARNVRISVARSSRNPVFTSDSRSNVSAVVYAPAGPIELRERGNFVGSFVGNVVRVNRGAIVQFREP